MSETDFTPSGLIRMAADGAFNDSAIDAAEHAALARVAELLEGLSTHSIKRLLRIKELAKKIVKVDIRTSTTEKLVPVFVVDHEAAKELLEIL